MLDSWTILALGVILHVLMGSSIDMYPTLDYPFKAVQSVWHKGDICFLCSHCHNPTLIIYFFYSTGHGSFSDLRIPYTIPYIISFFLAMAHFNMTKILLRSSHGTYTNVYLLLSISDKFISLWSVAIITCIYGFN